MTVSAILLFGSRARRDHSPDSDTDLLFVEPLDQPRHVSVGRVSMFFYGWSKLVTDAKAGNLFVCHLVQEARAISDPTGRLEKLRILFKLRPNYNDEIAAAIDLGWYLARFGDLLNSNVAVRRMVWCVRTILIARSAERRVPTFAPIALAAATQSASAKLLLQRRHEVSQRDSMRFLLGDFLEGEAASAAWHQVASHADYLAHFTKEKNEVALQTFRQGTDVDGTGYL